MDSSEDEEASNNLKSKVQERTKRQSKTNQAKSNGNRR
jgi:hypothetical protein